MFNHVEFAVGFYDTKLPYGLHGYRLARPIRLARIGVSAFRVSTILLISFYEDVFAACVKLIYYAAWSDMFYLYLLTDLLIIVCQVHTTLDF